jgi:hypothetical protein
MTKCYNITVMRLYTIEADSLEDAERFALVERGEDEEGDYRIDPIHSEIHNSAPA